MLPQGHILGSDDDDTADVGNLPFPMPRPHHDLTTHQEFA
jgi:hypothetical protein